MPSPHVAEIKALGHALRLYSAVRRVDDLAEEWIEKKWREKKPEELDEEDRAEYYRLKEDWERAIESFKEKTTRFIERFGKSPFLRYARHEEPFPFWGDLTLGFRSPQAKGYRIIELHYPEWFEELHIKTEGLSKEEVLEIAPPPPSPLYPSPVQYVKVRFLKEVPAIVGADIKTYGPFKESDIVEIPKENAEVLVKQGLASYELVAPPVPAVPPILTDEEKTMLNIFFLDKLKGASVSEPEKYKPEFEKALDVSKNYEFNLAVARDVADDIIERVRPIAKMIEVHVKVKVSEGEDPGTYVAMLMHDAFEVIFLGLTSTPALKTFLEHGEEWVDFTEQYRMAGFEEEEMMTHLAELPYPFSTGARIRVYWKHPEDVEFTEKAKEWWNIYYMTYLRPELEALTVPVLTDIAKIKQVRIGRTKEELISSILGLPPPAAPPVVAPLEKRPLREIPEQIQELTAQLEKEGYSMFLSAGLPREDWLKHWATIKTEIKSAIDFYENLPKLEAEDRVRGRVVKFISALIERVKVPTPKVHKYLSLDEVKKTWDEFTAYAKLRYPDLIVDPTIYRGRFDERIKDAKTVDEAYPKATRLVDEIAKELVPRPPPVVPRMPAAYPYIPPAVEAVELEADFPTFLKECGITMEEYRRLESIGRMTMREEYRRWKGKPYS